jgi:hypothetical protein
VTVGLPRQYRSPLSQHEYRLRSAHEVIGYRVHARDGDVGHVSDYIVDPAGWTIKYLVIETSSWMAGRSVAVEPALVRDVSWID